MYPIIICEDDPAQLHAISTIIKNFILFHEEDFSHSFSTSNPEKCLDYLKSHHIRNGIYLLDIDLGTSMNGIDLAEQIRQLDVQSEIIFITTHNEMAPLTLKRRVEALGFIDKDNSLEKIRDEIYETLNLSKIRSDERKKTKGKNFNFSIGSRIFNFDLDDVLMLETSKTPHRINLFTKNGEYEFYGKLRDYEKKYIELFRCSKSALINVKNISEYDTSTKMIYFNSSLSCKCSIIKSRELKQTLLHKI
ncbi:LytR/AlgR family response regulator transcription factor [Pediococcus stilesii]|uniref:Response regulator n=1 Tax=Pediococcus stilesii TaxID=331679 RepID=A0A0R2L3S3_9LACO|nr:LytTR family DNA-binding domain-containing protein [Pediococcus stilesii]KRN94156.1 response regulator [Pediococcus stilesii]